MPADEGCRTEFLRIGNDPVQRIRCHSPYHLLQFMHIRFRIREIRSHIFRIRKDTDMRQAVPVTVNIEILQNPAVIEIVENSSLVINGQLFKCFQGCLSAVVLQQPRLCVIAEQMH